MSLSIDEQYELKSILHKQIGTDEEIDILAAALLASAAQTNQMVLNVTDKPAVEVTSYEDMWKLSIANYYSGSGCLSYAIYTSLDDKRMTSWNKVASHLPIACIRAKEYVEKVLGNEEKINGGI
ncbi:MAG: hypothetical protein LWX83_12785, partial [Anaerolineae bacterium]|nr:hypothetical protein [Anaerolineae bacterium]